MKFLLLTLLVAGWGVMLGFTPLQAQPETTIVYLLTTTQSEHSLTVSSLDGSERETLYTVPFESKGTLPTLFPQEEVSSLNEYLTTLQSNVWRADVPLTEALVSGKINSVFISQRLFEK